MSEEVVNYTKSESILFLNEPDEIARSSEIFVLYFTNSWLGLVGKATRR